MEIVTPQCEGRSLFECSSFGGIFNIFSAYHHVYMAPEAFPCLGFEWGGSFYCFEVPPLVRPVALHHGDGALGRIPSLRRK
jgi:hypothetical protein